jgi:hypothetical protein
MIETLLITMALTAAYAIGKGIGRAQGRQQALHINGDTIGGFGIVGYEIGVPTRDTDT